MSRNKWEALLLGLVLTASIVACSGEETVTETVQYTTRSVTFKSQVAARTTTDTWQAGDSIGVYMKKAGQSLAASSVVGTAANVPYLTAVGNGQFVAAGAALKYPTTAVDFIAYRPYDATAGLTLAVRTADQSDRSKVDLLYADNLADRTEAMAAVATPTLVFTPQMAQVQLVLRSADSLDLRGVTVTLHNVLTTADFRLDNATFENTSLRGDIALRMSGSALERTGTAFVLPQTLDSLHVTLTAPNGTQRSLTLSRNISLEKGGVYDYTQALTGVGEAWADYAAWTETPTITVSQLADTTLRYLVHYIPERPAVRNYAMLYDTQLKMARWVAYPLCDYYTQRGTERTDEWGIDPSLDRSQQAVLLNGMSNGYDRGHQIASADRLVTAGANRQTFYGTNMTPQVGKGLNQDIWAALETQVRNWSVGSDTLYVVTGAVPSDNYTRDNDGKTINIPSYYFKALCRLNRSTNEAKTIAFRLDNRAYSGTDFMSHSLSVAALEALTGFTFFPDVKAEDKQNVDKSYWK